MPHYEVTLRFSVIAADFDAARRETSKAVEALASAELRDEEALDCIVSDVQLLTKGA